MVTAKLHATLLASPGMGHLIPMVELGKRLLTHHGFDVTIFVVTTDSSTTRSQILQQTTNLSDLNIVIMPPVDVSSKLGPNPSLGAQVVLTMLESLPLLRSSILSMKHRPSVLIVDLFGTIALPMARELGMSTYVFFATSAWFSALTIYFPVIDKQMEDRHVSNHEPLWIPGCKPVRFEDTLEPFLYPSGPIYEGYLKAAKDVISADGILMNTWQDLEPGETKAVRESGILGRFTKGPVYPVGPLVRTIEPRPVHEHERVLQWLDRGPAESVVYVSFGSGGTMSGAQMRELALGLELSRQRFVWVVRPPIEDNASGSFFDVVKGRDETPDYLPEGFVSRTHEVGLVVPLWAPQAEILGHPSTGGFVTHCGWNSAVESILNGVPMVAWPLYAEQKMNASLLSEELGVAVRVKGAEGGVVGREEIVKLIRRVMVDEEGIVMRAKLKELKDGGEKAMSKAGSSYESLCQITRDCQLHLQGSTAQSSGCLGDMTHLMNQRLFPFS